MTSASRSNEHLARMCPWESGNIRTSEGIFQATQGKWLWILYTITKHMTLQEPLPRPSKWVSDGNFSGGPRKFQVCHMPCFRLPASRERCPPVFLALQPHRSMPHCHSLTWNHAGKDSLEMQHLFFFLGRVLSYNYTESHHRLKRFHSAKRK